MGCVSFGISTPTIDRSDEFGGQCQKLQRARQKLSFMSISLWVQFDAVNSHPKLRILRGKIMLVVNNCRVVGIAESRYETTWDSFPRSSLQGQEWE